MIYADLLAAHKGQLGKAIERFRQPGQEADLQRHLSRAGRWIDLRWPRTMQATLILVPLLSEYPALPGCLSVFDHAWGRGTPCVPWDHDGPGYPPLLELIHESTGPVLWVSPPPTPVQIHAWSAVMNYRYRAAHEISPTSISVDDSLFSAVLLAALIEAMRELATETAVTQLHKGLSGIPTAGTPAYLYEALIREWERL